jgi:hypothetical protein
VVQRKYFGLEARAFRTGVARALARVSPHSPTVPPLDADSIAQDFRVDPKTGTALLHALVAGGLLQTDKEGKYRATTADARVTRWRAWSLRCRVRGGAPC